MAKSPGSFVFNVDQRKIPEPWKKPVVLLAVALLAAASLGAAVVLGKKADDAAVKTEDERVPKDAKLSDYGVRQVVQVSSSTGSKQANTIKSTATVKGHDLTLVSASAAPSGDGLRLEVMCDAAKKRYTRSQWSVHFPDGRQTATLNGDLCFEYGDTTLTTLTFHHAQHGYGGYTLKGTVYETTWRKISWGGNGHEEKATEYVKEIQVTQEGWRSWWK